MTSFTFRRLLLASILASCATACTVTSSPPEGEGGGGAGGVPEGGAAPICAAPSQAADDAEGAWTEPNEKHQMQITVPNDPAGGIVQVNLRAFHPDVRPWLNITHAADEGGSIASGPSEEEPDPQLWTGRFVAAPGETYDLELFPWFNAPTDEHPVAYEVTWTYEGLEDCYEPNNTQPEAAPIALGEEIEALLTEGFVGNYETAAIDWYRITLDEPTAVRFRLLQGISEQGVTMRLFDGDKALVNGGNHEVGLYDVTSDVLEPGEYHLEIDLTFVLDQAVQQSQPDPAHWTEPYRFVVEAVAP